MDYNIIKRVYLLEKHNPTFKTIHVVTENGGKIIVTVNPFRGAK